MPPGGEGSLLSECCLLPCVGARCLSGRHLQSCGAGRHQTPSQDSTVSALSQSLPVCWVMGGKICRCHACCAIPPHPGIRAPFFSSSSVRRTVNPGGILQAPPAVLVLARPGQPLYWARCPYGLIPLRVIPYVYSSTVRFPSW